MSLPDDFSIQVGLTRLILKTTEGRMHCQDVYSILAKTFPQLSEDEKTAPYRNSISHWANRVQFARQHLVDKGWLLDSTMGGGRGYWAISDKGRRELAEFNQLGKKALAKLNAV